MNLWECSFSQWRKVGILLLSFFVALGCSEDKKVVDTPNRTSPYYQGPAEESYCSTTSTYGDPVTITGSAGYYYRTYFGTQFSGGLGSVQGSTKPIRRAEVRAYNSSGSLAQCGETDNSGNFSINLPKNTGTYTIQINSRGSNSYVNATVFNRPEFNKFYTISTTIGTSASGSTGAITAEADGSVIGGAFNIFDQIVEANAYLKSNVGSGTCGGNGCTETDVAPKVNIYWEAGFNPGSYIGSSSISYYIPGYSRIFILGGLNGNVNSSDTDHFDNSVILHEYGHFLEDVLFKSDSPGGSHNGNQILDPRLAWSEGWGNFLQAAILNDPKYIDTTGNSDGSTGFLFYADLENNSSPSYDNPATGPNNSKGYGTRGEGNFREFSITRFLWDTVDAVNDSESITGGFIELWTALTNSSTGWKASKWAFRSNGLMQKIQDTQAGRTDWSGLRTTEEQIKYRTEYGQYITPDAGCADSAYYVTLTPSNSVASAPSKDYYRDHDFYHLKLTAATSGTLSVDFIDANSSGTKADLDVFVYDSDGRIFNTDDRVAYSIAENSSTDPSVSETENITINLPAGDYLLDVFSWYGTGGAVRYNMRLNNVKLCQKDPT